MQKQRTTWHLLAGLAVLASFGPSVGDGADADKEVAPKPLPPEIVKAWRDAGAGVGWMKDVPPQSGAFGFWEPWREKGEAGAVPAFRFPERDADGVLAKLPDPGTAFGLDFHCGWYAGVTRKELAKLKNLQSLSIGGVQGKAYADLKDLAGLTNLRGLYLFYLPVTDAQLKHVAGLKNLRALDLANTHVTDVGLKELSGLTSLQALNLSSTEVTDTRLKELVGLKNLQWLNLSRTRVTATGVAALQKELPKCKIIAGDDKTNDRRPLPALEERTQKLLDMQIALHNRTVALAKVAKGAPEDQPACLKLSHGEKDIVVEATKTLDMLKEEGAAVAFVELFQQLREDMTRVQRRLQAGEVGIETQSIQREIIDSLKETVNSLR